ncbi:hypothetical protein COLO4_02678 [Corchorus olitorius]|uniref:Uncharacterized protein n=1 Tax=Corchorus olitorius TaxID=93759 RepID=A0A1R3L0I3_9ROSI|nr:hypothetical protein COLO4_02678 [Corchorus olitorius]
MHRPAHRQRGPAADARAFPPRAWHSAWRRADVAARRFRRATCARARFPSARPRTPSIGRNRSCVALLARAGVVAQRLQGVAVQHAHLLLDAFQHLLAVLDQLSPASIRRKRGLQRQFTGFHAGDKGFEFGHGRFIGSRRSGGRGGRAAGGVV